MLNLYAKEYLCTTPKNTDYKDDRDIDGKYLYRNLTNELYTNQKSVPISFDGLKKKGIRLTKDDVKNGHNYFTIVNTKQTKTFLKSTWDGMNLIDGVWLPHGFKQQQ